MGDQRCDGVSSVQEEKLIIILPFTCEHAHGGLNHIKVLNEALHLVLRKGATNIIHILLPETRGDA